MFGNNLACNRSLTSTLKWVSKYVGIRVIPCLSARVNIQQAILEVKRDTVQP